MPGEAELNGTVWVKDGKIFVSDPKPGGKPASIVPHKEVEVFVSGKRISSEESITSSNKIEVRLPIREPHVNYHVEIAKGGLEAVARIELEDGLRYYLVDKPPAQRLELEVGTEPVKAVPEPQKLLEAIRTVGVEFGIDMEAVESCRERPGRHVFVVARGKPPEPGKDGKIDFLVPLERVVDLPADVLQVDFREIAKVPDVKQGQVIAVKTHPVPGSPGKAVNGAVIQAQRPKDPKFRAGKGVEFQERDGKTVAVATVSGCPVFNEDSGTISVDPVYTHRGDVDMASGNIRSSGSVCILGQVTEGMKVESEGNQEISGAVTEAMVRAGGSVRINGNVFKSTVVAGKDTSWVTKMDELLRAVEERLEAILSIEGIYREALERKRARSPEPGDDTILDELAQIERFRNLAVALSNLLKENVANFPEDIAAQVRATREMLMSAGADVFERAHGVSKLIQDARLYVDSELMGGKSDVILPYAQNSTIEASRDITITGQGAFYCVLRAGRAVKTSGSPGLIRGGEARARELIQVNAAGGQGVAPTVLAVGLEGKILVNTVYPNTILSVGPQSYRTEDTYRNVKASMVDGRLVVDTAVGPLRVD